MRKLITILVSLALPACAFAQSVPVDNTTNPTNTNRVQGTGGANRGDPVNVRMVTCSGGTCVEAPGGGGGGGGAGTADSTAANQATQITAANLTNTILGAVTASPTANTVSDRLKTLNITLGSPFQAGGSIGNTSFASTQSGTWNITNVSGTVSLPTGASTAANQSTGNTSLATIATNTTGLAGTVGTLGSTAPTTAQLAAGVGPTGNARGIATDTGGRLIPGQGVVASVRTTLTASTATALESAAVSGRVGVTVFTEATLTGNVYICATQTTSCSATGYDFLIPNGAPAGTTYTFMFGTTGRVYAYSTGTPVVVLNSWTAN